MPRETVPVKASRLLTAGQVTLLAVDAWRITARVQGDHDTYTTGWDASTGWWCDCPAVGPKCSHVAAVRQVTTANPARFPLSEVPVVEERRR